jgi:hypothetical protein
MDTKGRSSLYGKNCQLLGFGFTRHPMKAGWKVQVVFYRTIEKIPEYLICVSDVKKEDPVRTQEMRKNLGTTVPGELIALFVHRSIQGAKLTYLTFRQEMTEAFSEVQFDWWIEN